MWSRLAEKQQQRKRLPNDQVVYSKALPHLPTGSQREESQEQSTRPRSSRALQQSQQAPSSQAQHDRVDGHEVHGKPVVRSRVSGPASRTLAASTNSTKDIYVRDQKVDIKENEAQRSADLIRQLRLDLDLVAAKNQSLEQELLGLQEKQFQQMVDPRYAPPEDSVIQDQLSDIQQKINKIGKDCVAAQVEGLSKRSEEERSQLRHELHHVALLHESVPAMIEELKRSTTFGRMCFTALLSWHVHCGIFRNPFFFMRDRTTISNWYEVFSHVDQLAHGANAEQANVWRSQTLRYFMPEGKSDQVLQVCERTATFRRKASEVAARDFLSSAAMILVYGKGRDEFDALESRVIAIFDQAAEFSMRLWCQNVPLRISSMSDLAAVKFRMDSPWVKAHPLHKVDDLEDTTLDDRSVRIMVHPLVSSSDTQASAQTNARVFMKATVVLEEVS